MKLFSPTMLRALTDAFLASVVAFTSLLALHLLLPSAAAERGAAAATYPNNIEGFGESRLVVNTTSGWVRGARVAENVVAWRGIPYAEPPLGSLRFEPPRPLARRRAGVLDASRYGPMCFQFIYAGVTPSQRPREDQSEDCLTVNIYRSFSLDDEQQLQQLQQLHNGTAASGGGSDQLLPVLVSVHGGGFVEGSAPRESAASTAAFPGSFDIAVTLAHQCACFDTVYSWFCTA
jgi:hypothetical protein